MFSVGIFVFSLIVNINPLTFNFPNIGNSYINKFNIPLIGQQKITAEIVTNNTANIELDGLIKEKGYCKYGIFNNKLYIIVNSNLKKILNKFNTEFGLPEYDKNEDELKFKINIKKLRFEKQLILKRYEKM